MSVHSPSRNRYQHSEPSEEQDQYIRQLKAQKQYLQQQKTQKYKSILQKTYAMQQTGNNINVNLQDQTQKLQNIHSISNQTGKLVKKANQTSKQLSSFWYALGKKIIRVFVKNPDSKEDTPTSVDKKNQSIETKSDNTGYHFDKCQSPVKVQSQSEQDNLDDHYLDQISNQIGKLKFMAKQTNKQLTKQTGLINKIDSKTDYNSSKMQQANKRLKKNFF